MHPGKLTDTIMTAIDEENSQNNSAFEKHGNMVNAYLQKSKTD